MSSIPREIERQRTQAEERALFLLLFYRERIGRLAGRLQLQEDVKDKMRKRHRKHGTRDFDLNIRQVSQLLAEVVARAEDETRCNDICKSMYFCDLKKGHRRKKHKEIHGEGGLVW